MEKTEEQDPTEAKQRQACEPRQKRIVRDGGHGKSLI